MNMESMRVRSYRSIAADEHVPEEAAERYRTLKACGNLRAAGCNEEGRTGAGRDQPQDAVPVAGRAGRERPARPGAEVDPSPPYPAAGLEAQGRQGGDGRAPQVPVHGQGAHPRHAGAQGRPPERVDGRPDHRTRPGGRRDPSRVVLRGTRPSPSGGAASRRRRLRGVGDAVEVRLQGPQAGGTRADRPYDLRLRRADAEGVPGRLSGLQVHGDAGLLACHRRQNAAG